MTFYGVVRLLFRAAAAPYFRFRVEGAEHVPAEGPVVVVAAHRSWLDPPALGGACRRPVRFLIRDRVYAWRWATWFYRRMLAIPVSPGTASLPALRGALRALKAGEVVGIFPEGTVVDPGGTSAVQPGAALLAVRTGAPLVWADIEGTARAWPHGRRWPGPSAVQVRFHPPFRVDPEGGREEVDRLIALIDRELDRDRGRRP